mmetsp:Transcript_3055/g.5394  ORF Transcript_3055/g.5394 Transcript_3055/m.5394 type:complete len:131 (-) Transcript_3055:220-612(-)
MESLRGIWLSFLFVLVVSIGVHMVSTVPPVFAQECILPNTTHCTCQNRELFECAVPSPERPGDCFIGACTGVVCSCDFNEGPATLCELVDQEVFIAEDPQPGASFAACTRQTAAIPLPLWASAALAAENA